jgi:peptidylprolyl isomerase
LPQSRHRKTNKARKRPKALNATAPVQPATGRNRQALIIAIVIVLALVATVVAYRIVNRTRNNVPVVAGPEITTPSGLKYSEEVVGTGATPRPGQMMSVNYTGWLADGTKFDSSLGPGKKPLEFQLGTDGIIKGWNEAIATMKVGGKRRLVVPPSLAYGKNGNFDRMGKRTIPPDATLTFDVELLGVK